MFYRILFFDKRGKNVTGIMSYSHPITSCRERSLVPSLRSPLVDEERMTQVGDFPRLGSVLFVFFSALALLVGRTGP